MNKKAKLIHCRKRVIYDDDDSDDEGNSNKIRDDVAIDEDAESIGTFTCDGPVDLRFSSLLAPNYNPMLQVPGEFMWYNFVLSTYMLRIQITKLYYEIVYHTISIKLFVL